MQVTYEVADQIEEYAVEWKIYFQFEGGVFQWDNIIKLIGNQDITVWENIRIVWDLVV